MGSTSNFSSASSSHLKLDILVIGQAVLIFKDIFSFIIFPFTLRYIFAQFSLIFIKLNRY